MRVALDAESVLADPNEAVARATDRLTLDQIEQTWFSDSEESNVYQIYMGVSDAVWRHNPHVIECEEPNITEHVDALYDSSSELDIVTHRQHVDEQVRWWLSEHDITYDKFVSCDVPKNELGYDCYIDDNPTLCGDCRLFLRDQPWNRQIDEDGHKLCDRIYSLDDVLRYV